MIGVDLFAGLGGFSLGASMASVKIVWAANHWQEAVDVHTKNHPHVQHVCQDLHQADWESVPHMDLLLASPACQGHSKARGKDRPHHDKTRSTAWAVVSCMEFHRPFAAIVENVPEFLKWALFPAWKDAVEALGYSVSTFVFDAADAGVPQNRLRSFVIAVRGKTVIDIKPPCQPHKKASSIIDWKNGRWTPVIKTGRAEATLERYRHGKAHFGDRFVMSYYGNTRTARSIDRPIGTITTRDRWGIVNGDNMRMFSVSECLVAMGFPKNYSVPDKSRLAIHMIGNAIPPPLAAHVIEELRRAA